MKMCRNPSTTEDRTEQSPSAKKPPLILRVGLVLLTLLILHGSQVLYGRYLVSKSNAESLELLEQFIYNSENSREGFALGIRETQRDGYAFLEQPVSPADFAAFSSDQKRIFIEAFYNGLPGIEPPPEPESFHPNRHR